MLTSIPLPAAIVTIGGPEADGGGESRRLLCWHVRGWECVAPS